MAHNEEGHHLGEGGALQITVEQLGGTLSTVSPESSDTQAAAWAGRILSTYRRGIEAIIETGRLLIEAKAELPHGAFADMVNKSLPFGDSMARKLMAIARDSRIGNREHVHVLPASSGTLYELTKLSDEQFEARIADGTINPGTERSEIVAARQEHRRAELKADYQARKSEGCTVDDLRQLIAEGAQFSAIYADPNWRWESWSEKGKGRSPDQHYDTDPLGPIKALPVKELSAPNSVLHLQCMDWLLPGALEIIDAWGFKYIKVGFIWVKQNPSGDGSFMGLGKWTREGAELCLLATKGNPTRLDAGVRQVLFAPVGEHSKKPEKIQDRIERLTTGPYLELFARRQRPEWTCWGDEIPRKDFQGHEPLKPVPASVSQLPEAEQSELASPRETKLLCRTLKTVRALAFVYCERKSLDPDTAKIIKAYIIPNLGHRSLKQIDQITSGHAYRTKRYSRKMHRAIDIVWADLKLFYKANT